MKKRSIFALLLALLVLAGCGQSGKNPQPELPSVQESEGVEQPSGGDNGENTDIPQSVKGDLDTSDLFSNRDLDPSYAGRSSEKIVLDGKTVSTSAKAVTVSGTTVTISAEGVYIISGTLDDGMIIVDAPKEDKIQLVLDGATLNSETCAPIYVRQADKVFITLEEGSKNTLSNGGSFEPIDENDIDAVIFSKEDLTLNGTGSLTVESPVGHGVVSKDELTVAGGTYTVNSAAQGFNGKDCVCIADAVMTVTAGKDGIHSENNDDASLGFVYIQAGTFVIDAQGDGISASAQLQIDGGTYNITTGGGSENGSKATSDSWGNYMPGGGMGGMGGRPGGMGGRSSDVGSSSGAATSEDSTSIKGLKATGLLTINGGTFSVDCADDAVHSNSCLTVNSGAFEIATGDDGFHADDTLTFNGGTVNITESYEGLEALHIKYSAGDVTLVASDDGLNAAGGTDQSGFGGGRGDMFGGMGGRPGGGMGGMGGASNGTIEITGGTLRITASGDGIDANGSLAITGGYITVCGPTQGDTSTLDYDASAEINGGTFIGTGASNMAQTFSGGTQGVIALNVGGSVSPQRILLTDSEGNTIVDYTPELSFAVVILSTPEMIKGETYKITIGEVSGEFKAS